MNTFIIAKYLHPGKYMLKKIIPEKLVKTCMNVCVCHIVFNVREK